MFRTTLVLLIATLLLLPTSSARESTSTYVGPTPFIIGCNPLSAGACADVLPGETRVSIRVDDASGAALAFGWQTASADDVHGVSTVLSSGSACGSVANVPIPAGANRVYVTLKTEAQGACGASLPTAGTVVLDFA